MSHSAPVHTDPCHPELEGHLSGECPTVAKNAKNETLGLKNPPSLTEQNSFTQTAGRWWFQSAMTQVDTAYRSRLIPTLLDSSVTFPKSCRPSWSNPKNLANLNSLNLNSS